MSLIEKAENRRSPTAGEGCPAWCVFDHDHKEEPVTILHESLPTVIEVSRRLDGGVCEWIDVRTTQYRPEEPNEPPWPPAIELSYHRGSRYRITTLTADEATRLAACLSAEAAHADDLAAERPAPSWPAVSRPRSRERSRTRQRMRRTQRGANYDHWTVK